MPVKTAPHLPYRQRSLQCSDSRWCARSSFRVKCFEQKLQRRSSLDEAEEGAGDDLGDALAAFPGTTALQRKEVDVES